MGGNRIHLRELLTVLPHLRLTPNHDDRPITGIAFDSRSVKPANIFVCRQGARFDGHRYIPQAVQQGAAAVVVERDVQIPPSVAQIQVPDGREALARLANHFYGYPSADVRVIGVTGTNGKTTTTYLLKGILEQAGYKVGLIGTNEVLMEDHTQPSVRTTPESSDLFRLLRTMANRDIHYVIMEVSSHAIALQRLLGCRFHGGILTNITHDHLDFHGSFADYRAVKTQFFRNLGDSGGGYAAINADTEEAQHVIAATPVPTVQYGIRSKVQVHASSLRTKGRQHAQAPRNAFRCMTPVGEVEINLPLMGRFNIYNALGAIAAALQEGIGLQTIKTGLEDIQRIQGRFEPIDVGQPFPVIVDYAHTPDALENGISAIREITTGRCIVIFGASGSRDHNKRARMGEIAATLADYCIITSTNPRAEHPAAICKDVESGARKVDKQARNFQVLVDRRDAITLGLTMARPGDVVLISGKGHETHQEVGSRFIPFDDRREAKRILLQLPLTRQMMDSSALQG